MASLPEGSSSYFSVPSHGPNWKGDDASYRSKHERVERARGKASVHACEHCDAGAKEWATIHDTPGSEPQHFIPLCISCHRLYDDGNESRGSKANRHGERNGRAKLCGSDVIKSKIRVAAGESILSISKELDVNWSTVKRAVSGETWRG